MQHEEPFSVPREGHSELEAVDHEARELKGQLLHTFHSIYERLL